MTTPIFILRRFMRRHHTALLRMSGRARTPAPRTSETTHSVQLPPDRTGRLQVGVVAVPTSSLVLVRLAGELRNGEIELLDAALDDVDDGLALHLDLTDLHIADAASCRALEHRFDALERRYVRTRVSGLRLPSVSEFTQPALPPQR
jgi:hypothetical protein